MPKKLRAKRQKKTHGVVINWGSSADNNILDQAADATTEHEFRTRKELEAFLEGVEAASGWMDYAVVKIGKNRKQR